MTPQTDTGRILAIATAIVATLAVATSIWLNPPSENRARRLDLQRLQRLSLTESAIGVYFAAHTALPKTLEALDEEKNQLQHQSWHDPVTGEPFQYEILEEKRYRLCANFERTTEGDDYYSRKHKAGRDCFETTIK